jgi:hypothetical protein
LSADDAEGRRFSKLRKGNIVMEAMGEIKKAGHYSGLFQHYPREQCGPPTRKVYHTPVFSPVTNTGDRAKINVLKGFTGFWPI